MGVAANLVITPSYTCPPACGVPDHPKSRLSHPVRTRETASFLSTRLNMIAREDPPPVSVHQAGWTPTQRHGRATCLNSRPRSPLSPCGYGRNHVDEQAIKPMTRLRLWILFNMIRYSG